DRVIGACAASPECQRSQPRLASDLAALLARFEAGPLPASVRTSEGRVVPISMARGDFGYSVRGMLYNPSAVTTLPGLIHHAATSGDVSEFAQFYWDRHVQFDYTLALGEHFSVLCSEDVPFVRGDEIEPATAG